jgi:hypothetical protein
MKQGSIILVLFISYFSFAQDAPDFPEYNAKDAANIFYYNFSKVPEEIKVKDEVTKSKTLKSLRLYNDKIKKISFLNSLKLQELELTINSIGKRLYSDRDLALKVKQRLEKTILPIRDSIDLHEKTLNDNLKSFLSKRQFRKWLKYQKLEKRKLIPEAPKRQNNPPSNMNSRNRRNRGNQQGMGRRRY